MNEDKQDLADAVRKIQEVGLEIGKGLNEQMRECARAVNASMAQARKKP